ncbi:MAG: uroporphyrinogen decarboxylase [Chloroflexi bacterium]|nr:uroporphyrinogen decarboxylase [Chloroflexota bacterium]OJV98326.1 MAG: uroporphyrinogen decarboxylase [Chloroflexi bacterium 54-19]
MLSESRFIKACRREPVDATPVWFMRQAGRYMPEYREIRGRMSMLEAIRNPEVSRDITLQPINAFQLDAAIIFADILTPLIGMGIDLDFIKGEGPHIENPLRTTRDIDMLGVPAAAEALPFALEAIRLTAAELTPRGIPLIGFCGAPFTLASYAIEGGGSRNYERTKGMMYAEPAAWKRLMDKLVTVLSDLLARQVEAGASALQIFDSWAGALSPYDFDRYVAPYTRQLIENARKSNVPVIYFSTGTSAMLDEVARLGSDVVSVDWRVRLDRAWQTIGSDRAIQGNLDPLLLFAPWREVQAQADEILAQAGGRPGHIFNLGHGILPGTPVETVARLAEYIHEKTARLEQVNL